MLTLLLLRHAKAVPHLPDGDHARCLTEAGRASAERLGVFLAEKSLLPEVAVVSAATRTRQTFDAVQAGVRTVTPGATIAATFDESLYNATAPRIGDVLRGFDTALKTALIVGHNPGILDLAVVLSRDGDRLDIERMRNRFPPCSLAVLTFDTNDWRDARASGGRLDLFLVPEDLVSPS